MGVLIISLVLPSNSVIMLALSSASSISCCCCTPASACATNSSRLKSFYSMVCQRPWCNGIISKHIIVLLPHECSLLYTSVSFPPRTSHQSAFHCLSWPSRNTLIIKVLKRSILSGDQLLFVS